MRDPMRAATPGLPTIQRRNPNGYSLARRVLFEEQGWTPETQVPDVSELLGEALLQPTTIYVKLVKALLGKSKLHGLAHITGGGITGNLPRILPESCRAEIDRMSWTPPSIFNVIQRAGNIDQDEMFTVFNMGVGLIIVAPSKEAGKIVATIQGQGMAGWVMGEIHTCSSSGAKLTYSR